MAGSGWLFGRLSVLAGSPAVVALVLIVAHGSTGCAPGEMRTTGTPEAWGDNDDGGPGPAARPGSPNSDAAIPGTPTPGTDGGPLATPDPTRDGGPMATPRDGGAASPPAEGWLGVTGNRIVHADGTPFHGRGANIHDTRSCNACTWGPPNVAEVNRRIDLLVDGWHANFMRLTLESYGSADGRTHYASLVDDDAYLDDIVEIIEHIGTKPGAYVLVSLWVDPSFDDLGSPTEQTQRTWRALASRLMSYPQVMFGLVNEPEQNFDGSLDGRVWAAMNGTVEAIRDEEERAGSPQHIISVQGTGAWARRLDYYVDHPIAARGGSNVVYETHVYDPASEFERLFIAPSRSLPVIIGEFGEQDANQLMTDAERNGVPYLAWTFHMRCPPNLLVENSGGGCGIDMRLEPTAWGRTLMARLAAPWAAP